MEQVAVEKLTDVVAALGITIKAQHMPHATLPESFKGHERSEWSNTGGGIGSGGGWVTIPASAWRVTLEHKGRTMETDFYQGSGHTKLGAHGTIMPKAPSAADVLACLASDAGACEQPFEEWASDYGYDTDSRKAEATYRACQEVGFKVKRLLGEDFERVRNAEH